MDRRNFLKLSAATTAAAALPKVVFPNSSPLIPPANDKMIWAFLMHISYNFWVDYTPKEFDYDISEIKNCQQAYLWAHKYHPFLTCDKQVWDDMLVKVADSGMNMIILDLGDGIKYRSHPEIAVKNAWTVSQLKAEIKKIRSMGLEPIPKLNFSACHGAWLGPYSRMISTKKYYEVCKNLINEVSNIFEKPRYFHLGMDEEDYKNQSSFEYVTIRQGDLWWKDFYYLVELVEKNNSRPWIWSDYVWDNEEIFFKKMPKSVLQSNWYYRNDFAESKKAREVIFYDKLDKNGFDQVPTGSNHSTNQNFELTVDYCKKNIDASRLKGFMQSVWRPTLQPCKQKQFEAIEQVKNVIKKQV